MNNSKVFAMKFNRIYPMYIEKVEKKGRTRDEVDQVFFWLTGYDAAGLQKLLDDGASLEAVFKQAPCINANASLVTGTICGYRVEEIEDETMRNIRRLDKLVDELAKGKSMEKILRK